MVVGFKCWCKQYFLKIFINIQAVIKKVWQLLEMHRLRDDYALVKVETLYIFFTLRYTPYAVIIISC